MITTTWLVDLAYVVKASEGKFKLDYVLAEQFIGEVCGPTRTFLFNGYDEEYGIPDGLMAFYNAMENQYGMHIRLHPMQSGAPETNRQRRVDVDFGAHMVWQASLPDIHQLVITTGDQDFIPAVEIVREAYGKDVFLFTYNAMVNHELIDIVTEWWIFEDQEDRLARW